MTAKASVYDLAGDLVIYRNLDAAEPRLPRFVDAWDQMGLPGPARPRKLDPAYSQALAWILRRARALDAPSVLLGSAKEFDLCQQIAASANAWQPEKCRNLAGKTSLAQAFMVIAAARSTVSNDSGLMHVAAALGVPQVALFGSSSPLHTPPLNARARVLWLKNDAAYQPPLDCAPCFERHCPLGHTRCLTDIAVSDVLHYV